MGNLCSSPDLTKILLKQYGNSKVLNYAQYLVGTDIINLQATNLRNLVTKQYGSSESGQSNPVLMQEILGQALKIENNEKANIQATKPIIPELDKASPQVQNTFLNTIEKKFTKEITTFKTKFSTDMASKFNANKFLNMRNVDNVGNGPYIENAIDAPKVVI